MKRLLTGDRPTGRLHLGHYVGTLESRLSMQDNYNTFIMLADAQALTDNFEHPGKVHDAVREVALDNLSVGINPKKVTLFIQSQIPELAELSMYFMNRQPVSHPPHARGATADGNLVDVRIFSASLTSPRPGFRQAFEQVSAVRVAPDKLHLYEHLSAPARRSFQQRGHHVDHEPEQHRAEQVREQRVMQGGAPD